ncbi:Npun_F0296 family exosortase-dependent surface protein [Edaphosphingomonas haloaromaticamans]|uniref:Ice-binding protein C-terminal domain-containing protein n=1 Tax=Edaphosphingomonas haloaromaticamans TaxID=653954 RepID=A0A1S1H9U6_9SPHN|nr:PEPxxWA-CTERM sorting domain-containing protein [Sphingomonas haloaromaticamans]OHT18894.1 hypothetical protein BHE75_00874 [Sphingomonas haloaromaticamans]
MFKTLAAALLLTCAATSANAATFVFAQGEGGAKAFETVIADFNDPANNSLVSGINFSFLDAATSGGTGALPGAGDGSRYLSVLGGGYAEISLPAATSFSIDVGSLDSYNLMTLLYSDGTTADLSGDTIFNGDADGNQTSPSANGRLTVWADAGKIITGIRFSSDSNSFEVDNLAITAVPEPSAWALMLAGFGLIGTGLRSRRRGIAPQAA